MDAPAPACAETRPHSYPVGAKIAKVAYLDVGGPAQPDTAAVARDIARENGSELTPVGLDECVDYYSMRRRLFHVLRAGAMAEPVSCTSAYDVVIAPAGVQADGSSARLESEVSAILAKFRRTPILRVRRRPLAIAQVLMLLDGTPACRALARRYVRLGLWADARVVVLPMDRPSVRGILQDEVEMLRSRGRSVTVFPALDLNFEAPELESILRLFPAAVVGHLSHREGLYFGAVRNDPFAMIAERVPLVLLP